MWMNLNSLHKRKPISNIEWQLHFLRNKLINTVNVHLHCTKAMSFSDNYHPQTKFGAPVCHSVHRGEYLGRYSPRAGSPPPGQVAPPGRYPPGRYIPRAGTPPWAATPPGNYTPRATTSLAMHAGIRSTSERYASYWNAFLWDMFSCFVFSGTLMFFLKINVKWGRFFLYCRLFHRQGAKLMHSKPLKGKPIEKQKQILEKAFKFTCVRNPFER